MKKAILSNYMIGDMVYVNMQDFKGYAKVSGVDNQGHGIYYYLTMGPTDSRTIIYASASEIYEAAPVAFTNKLGQSAPRFFIAKGRYDERD